MRRLACLVLAAGAMGCGLVVAVGSPVGSALVAWIGAGIMCGGAAVLAGSPG